MMTRLYYNPGSCSLAPHIVLEEIGEPYELALVSLANGEQHKPEYLAVNRHARVPALEVGDGTVITEVVAVLSYLARRHPLLGLLPADEPEQEARCLEWLAWLSTTVHVAIAQVYRPGRYVGEAADFPAVKARGHALLRDYFAEIDGRLAGAEHALGADYSVVDPFLFVFFRWGNVLKYDMATDYPSWSRLVSKLITRPAVQRAMAQEGITLIG